MQVAPPSVTFAVNLTGLAPGSYELVLLINESVSAGQDMRFRIERRPIYSFDRPRGEGISRAPCSTGLVEVGDDDGKSLVAAHEWPVSVTRWDRERPSKARVIAVTLFDELCVPVDTRWTTSESSEPPLAGWTREAFASWQPARVHAKAPPIGLGLPLPTLVGLPRQPISVEGNP